MIRLLKLVFVFSLLIFLGCEDNLSDVPETQYKEAIYLIDSGGENKQKVIDVDYCTSVQFVANSNRLLYLENNSLYVVEQDGANNQLISNNLHVFNSIKPSVSSNGQYVAFLGEGNSSREVYLIDLDSFEILNISNTIVNEEYCPKFLNSTNFLCYSSNSNDSNMLIKYDYVNMIKDTLYVSSNNIGDASFSTFTQEVYFTEKNDRSSATLKKINITTYEISNVITNVVHWNNGYFEIKNANCLIGQFTPSAWILFNLNNQNFISLGYVFYPSFCDETYILFSNERNTTGDISIFNTITNSVELTIKNGISPNSSLTDSRIVYIGRYLSSEK